MVDVDNVVMVGEDFYLVTGVHIGGQRQDSVVTLKPINKRYPSVYGKTVQEYIIPYNMLKKFCVYQLIGAGEPPELEKQKEIK
jgi:hypothetical protein